jgi:hypothetical protein
MEYRLRVQIRLRGISKLTVSEKGARKTRPVWFRPQPHSQAERSRFHSSGSSLPMWRNGGRLTILGDLRGSCWRDGTVCSTIDIMGAPLAVQPQTVIQFRSHERTGPVASCVLTSQALKRLYRMLVQLAAEAAPKQVALCVQQASETAEAFEARKQSVSKSLQLMVIIVTHDGEVAYSQSENIFDEDKLPYHIKTITFDNALLWKLANPNQTPSHRINVFLDLRRPAVFDFTTNASAATENASNIEVAGQEEAPVNGAFFGIQAFFKEHRSRRGWWHKRGTYDIILWFATMPAILGTVYKLGSKWSSWFAHQSSYFAATLYVYLIVLLLLLLRTLFNYGRWAFPFVQVDRTHQAFAPIKAFS